MADREDINLDLGNLLKGIQGSTKVLMDAIYTKTADKSCAKMRAFAKARAPVDTGRLRQEVESPKSVFKDTDGVTHVEYGIAVNLPYAIPVEFGTGTKGDPGVPHVPKDSWVYYSQEKHDFRTAHAMPARSYLRFALDTARKSIEAYMKEAVDDTLAELGKNGD